MNTEGSGIIKSKPDDARRGQIAPNT